MSYLEEDLKAALRRVEAPEDFSQRVLARAAAPEARPASWWKELGRLLRPPRVQWVALSVIASVLIPMAGTEYRKQRQVRIEGEMAKDRRVFAMRFAGVKLHHTQQKVLGLTQTDNRL